MQPAEEDDSMQACGPVGSEREHELSYLLEERSAALNLSTRCAASNYLRFADEIGELMGHGRILDWGCGYGQMSWLLDRRGLEVVSYDLQDKRLKKFVQPHVPFRQAVDDRTLPFPDCSFGGVLSCGVLEHVPDERKSLSEIHRCLSPGGHLFVYQLPQIYAYTEFVNRVRGLWYHERRYTPGRARALFEAAGFEVARFRRANLFPKNLTGLPGRARGAYNRFSEQILAAERVLVRVPVLNWVSHSLEFVLRKV